MQIHNDMKAKARAEHMSSWAKGKALELRCPKCHRKSALKKTLIADAGLLLITCRWQDCGYENKIQTEPTPQP